MGRIVTPQYAIHITRCASPKVGLTPFAWRVRKQGQISGFGKPTEANLAAWVAKFNESLEPGGCNDHCGPSTKILACYIVDQFSGEVMARYQEGG